MIPKIFTNFLSAVLLLAAGAIPVNAAVTHWRVVKGPFYLQSADNTPDATTTNWSMFGIVETDLPGDAASVIITGGNIPGSIAYELEGSEWELGVDYSSKAALDAVFPSDAGYSIILSGGTLGSVTQQFSFAADSYPNVPYLTGADYSDCLALEALEPFEVNWNNAGSSTAVSLQIFTGAVLDEGDVVFEIYSNNYSSVALPWNLFAANSNYNGFIDFANADLQSGAGGFGVDGDVSFNTALGFYINASNTAVGFDDFNDNTIDTNKWAELNADPGEAFTEVNNRLEYTSGGGDDLSVAWLWDAGDLSYTQDWAIAVNVANLLDPGTVTNLNAETYYGIAVVNDGVSNIFSMEHVVSEFGRELITLVDTNDVEVLEDFILLASTNVAMKISFDADTKLLQGAYSIGGDYVVTTNYSAALWGMTDSSVFTPAIYSGSDFVVVTNGQVYADNFRIYDGAVLSNEVDFVELEFLHSYGDGSIFTEVNEIKVEADSSQRIISMDVTTSGGDQFNVPLDGTEGATNFWDVDIQFPFSEPWDPANDGDWVVTFGLNNGTFQSIIIPFTKEDGITPMPNFYSQPMFVAPSPANGLFTTSNTFSFAWQPAVSNAIYVSLDEIVDGNDIGDIELFFSDGLPGDSEIIADVTIDGPLSTTNVGPIAFGEGFHRMRINEGYGRAAYTIEGVPYVVNKQNEADIIFTIYADDDSDGMDDDWEIDFFGGTNVVNGGPLDNFDGDSLNNLDEFIAGVDPTNSASVFAVEDSTPSPAGFVINWNSVPGRKYRVFWAKTLSDPFVSVTPGYLPYPQNSYIDTVHTNEGCGFYYIDVQLDN